MTTNDWRYSDDMMEYRATLLKRCVKLNGELSNRHYDFCDWVMSSGLYKRLIEIEKTDESLFTHELSALYLEYYYDTEITNKKKSSEIADY
tara:strand:- start:7 stop:279 length:273 start_codon:yes stop_codon:yes gene_type:complete